MLLWREKKVINLIPTIPSFSKTQIIGGFYERTSNKLQGFG
jgi:hypothetical protein